MSCLGLSVIGPIYVTLFYPILIGLIIIVFASWLKILFGNVFVCVVVTLCVLGHRLCSVLYSFLCEQKTSSLKDEKTRSNLTTHHWTTFVYCAFILRTVLAAMALQVEVLYPVSGVFSCVPRGPLLYRQENKPRRTRLNTLALPPFFFVLFFFWGEHVTVLFVCSPNSIVVDKYL